MPFRSAAVLAVVAHPDDESLLCGGTLARLAAAGWRVAVLCASRGERGSPAGPGRDESLAARRGTEARAAAEALGVGAVVLLDHPDGDLRWAGVAELQAQIVIAIDRFRPEAVITFDSDGLYWHLDHIGVHERTTTAVGSLGASAPALYYASLPAGLVTEVARRAAACGWQPPERGLWSVPAGAFGLLAPEPTLRVDAGPFVDGKIRAIAAHASQADSSPLPFLPHGEVRALFAAEHLRLAPAAGGADPLAAALRDIT